MDEPVADRPVAREPVVDEPVADRPVSYGPVVDLSVVDTPDADEPVAGEPVVELSVVEGPDVDEPDAEEPVASGQEHTLDIATPSLKELARDVAAAKGSARGAEPVADEPEVTVRSVETVSAIDLVMGDDEPAQDSPGDDEPAPDAQSR